MSSKSLVALLIACQVLIGPAAIAYDEKTPALEYQVKAAYIYNFTRFVNWPPSSIGPGSAPIKVCTIGDDPFGDALEKITEKTANGRPLAVSRLITADEIQTCQLLFVGSGVALEEILHESERSNILTVGEDDRFTELGGIIRFKLDEKRKRFRERVHISLEINKDVADRSGLQISSRLLQMATIVNHDR